MGRAVAVQPVRPGDGGGAGQRDDGHRAFVTARIQESVVRNSANATAMYMDSILSPISQQFARSDTLSPGAQRALEEIFADTPLGQRVVSYKFWRSMAC